MNYWLYVWIGIILLLVFGLLLLCRPRKFTGTAADRGYYVLVNRLTGYPCYQGKLYRTAKAAHKAHRKLSKLTMGKTIISLDEWIEVRKIV